MDDLITIVIGAVVGGILGAVGYTIDQALTDDGANWYPSEPVESQLFWAPAVWAGLLVTVIFTILWMAGVVRGVWPLTMFVGTLAALIGAYLWSAIASFLGVL